MIREPASKCRDFLFVLFFLSLILPACASLDVITHGSRDKPLIALTFDACQKNKVAGYDEKIIGILRNTHTPATLFLGGQWMESHPEITRELSKDPLFEIGSHSYSHPYLTNLSDKQIFEEIKKPQAIIKKITGKGGKLFRAPYGEYNEKVSKIIVQSGLKPIQWEVVSGDPDPNVNAIKMIQAVVSRTKNGSIVIFHMNKRGWHTAEALPIIIKKLKAKGFVFVTVSKLLE